MNNEEMKNTALYDFATMAQSTDMEYILVGAGARLLVMDSKYEAIMGRATNDWDLGIQVNSWEEYKKIKDTFLNCENKLFREDRVEHRIIHIPSSVPLDIIPFGEIAGDDEYIIWPRDESRMSVTGFQEVYNNAQLIKIKDMIIKVASEPGLAMLKVFAFEDRRKRDDMTDFFFILEQYVQEDDLERAYEIAGTHIIDDRIEYDTLSPFILGHDLGKIISMQTYSKLATLMKRIADPYSDAITILVGRIASEKEEEQRREEYLKK